MEDWLYDEGEDVTKSVYAEKLAELKQTGSAVELRFAEAQVGSGDWARGSIEDV